MTFAVHTDKSTFYVAARTPQEAREYISKKYPEARITKVKAKRTK